MLSKKENKIMSTKPQKSPAPFDDETIQASEVAKQIEMTIAANREPTNEELQRAQIKADAEIVMKARNFREKMLKGKKTKMRVVPAYRPYLGLRNQVIINGVAIVVPVDGTMFEVPSPFAAELYRRMRGVDAMLEKQSRMADYGANKEETPGVIQF